MPRKTRKQPGTSGGAYQNRTDLAQPIATPTGLPYGQAGELEQAQQAQPLPQESDPFAAALQAAKGFDPGGMTPLNAPSTRPDEPVTAGLPSGPGPGPEALAGNRNLSNLLQRLYAETRSPVVEAVLGNAQRMGL